MPLLRHRQQRLRQEFKLSRLHRQLPRASVEQTALNTEEISDIKHLIQLEILLGKPIHFEINLQFRPALAQMQEPGFALPSQRLNASAHLHRNVDSVQLFSGLRAKQLMHIAQLVREIKPLAIRQMTGIGQFLGAANARLKYFLF